MQQATIITYPGCHKLLLGRGTYSIDSSLCRPLLAWWQCSMRLNRLMKAKILSSSMLK